MSPEINRHFFPFSSICFFVCLASDRKSAQKNPKIDRSLNQQHPLQNNFGQTIASVYSVRARIGAPVSTPLKWEEVKKGLNPKDFTIKTIFPRLKKYKDLFFPLLGKGISLEIALNNLTKMIGY